MFDLSFLKDGYDAELARKDALSEALTLPAGVLGALVSALAVMGQGFPYQAGQQTTFFVIILLADGVCLLGCFIYLALAYHGRDYMYLPRMGELADARRDLHRWHANNGGSQVQADEEFAQELKERLIAAADLNGLNNDRRSGFLFVARVWLFALLTLTAVTAGTYMTAAAGNAERNVVHIESLPPLKVEGLETLVNAITMAKTSAPAPQQQPAPAPTPKPQFPSNRLVKESAVPKK